MSISKFGLKASVLFVFFVILGRILFPFADEPDVTVRVPEILDKEEHHFLSPYYLFHFLLDEIDMHSDCIPNAGVQSVWAIIDNNTCTENSFQIFKRVLLTLIVSFPILYFISFRSSFITMMNTLKIRRNREDWEEKLDVLSISIVFSGVIYFIGLLSVEQLTLIVSLLLFLFIDKKLIVLLLLFYLVSIDFGNALVCLLFVVLYYMFLIVYNKLGIKGVWISSIVLVLTCLILGITVLKHLQQIPILREKAEAMVELNLLRDFNAKYPIYFRPIITLITGMFMTPSGVKVLMIDICYFLAIGYVIIKYKNIRKRNIITDNEKLLFIAAVTTILCFVFMVPNYSFAKYYMFLIPCLLLGVVKIVEKKKILIFFIIMNFIMFFHLILYRL